MQAAEDLMSFESENFEEYKDHINNEVMKIFEACSFQDITGQRISKVVKTLNHVEDRVGKLISILGITGSTDGAKGTTSILDSGDGEISDKELLQGPALAGEGIDQSEIDSLLDDSFNTPDDAAPEAEAEPQAEAVIEEVVEEKSAVVEEDAAAGEEMSEADSDDDIEPEAARDDDQKTSQQDIDSLFG